MANSNFEFLYNKEGYFEVMGFAAMKSMLQKCAECVVVAADKGVQSNSSSEHHKWYMDSMRDGRPAAFVYTYSNAAKKAQNNSEQKNLEHAMAAAKGGVT